MYKRIMAWILLAGFVLLIVNIVFIHWQMTLSLSVYAVIAIFYILTMRKTNTRKGSDEENQP